MEDSMKRTMLFAAILVCAGPGSAMAQVLGGVTYTTIQACVNAAAALSTPGRCFVPTATPNTSQVEMASGGTLEFSAGMFTNTGSSGGIFVHFGSTVTGATEKRQGGGTTDLKNNSNGTQFGAVVQDQGTH